jgi:hypothetical protein
MDDEGDDGKATRMWRSSDEAPLTLRPNRSRWLVAIAALAGLVVFLLIVVLAGRRHVAGTDTAAAKVAPKQSGVEHAIDAPPPKPTLSPWIELRVSRIRISPPVTPWDGPREETGIKDKCKGIAVLAGLLSAGAGAGVGLTCGFIDDPQRQTDPTLPDLQLVLDVQGVRYMSYIAFDQVEHNFDYSFVLPAAVVPDNGLVLSVVDADDGPVRFQSIGSVRITKDELAEAEIGGGMMSLRPSGLDVMEVEAHPYDGGFKKKVLTLDAASGGANVQGFPISAGDVVRIEAAGAWRVGGYYKETLGPAGYPGGGPMEYNFGIFRNVPHGAAVAVVGGGGQIQLGPVAPCLKFVAEHAGIVWVGINDRDYGNNQGTVDFTVMKRGPSATQWTKPGVVIPCE